MLVPLFLMSKQAMKNSDDGMDRYMHPNNDKKIIVHVSGFFRAWLVSTACLLSSLWLQKN